MTPTYIYIYIHMHTYIDAHMLFCVCGVCGVCVWVTSLVHGNTGSLPNCFPKPVDNNRMLAGGRRRCGGAPPNEALLHTSGNVPACIRLGPQRGQLGILSLSCSSPSDFMLCHSWCLRQDPHPHGSFSLQVFMPFVMSGMLGTKFSSHSRYHHHHHQPHLVSLQHTTFFLSFFLTFSLLPSLSVWCVWCAWCAWCACVCVWCVVCVCVVCVMCMVCVVCVCVWCVCFVCVCVVCVCVVCVCVVCGVCVCGACVCVWVCACVRTSLVHEIRGSQPCCLLCLTAQHVFRITFAREQYAFSRKLLVKLRSLPHRVSLGLSGGGRAGGGGGVGFFGYPPSGAGKNPVAKGACFGPDFGSFG